MIEKFGATDIFGQTLDKSYASDSKLVEEFAKKHNQLCKEDVMTLIDKQKHTYKRSADYAIHSGTFGEVLAFNINGRRFVYKFLIMSGYTIINEADKYAKALTAYAARKKQDKEQGLIGTLLCPTMRMFRTFMCDGQMVSLLAEPLTRSLQDFMKNENPEEVHEIYISLFKQCLNGLSFMRNEFEFMHGDIKSNNVMLRFIDKDARFDYRADDLNFNGEEVVISMLTYQAVFIDFGYSTFFDYPMRKTAGNDGIMRMISGEEARRMSSESADTFGTIGRMIPGTEIPADAYFRGYRPFMLKRDDKNGMILEPVFDQVKNREFRVRMDENKRIKWIPNRQFREEQNVSTEYYSQIWYIDTLGQRKKIPTVPYFIPKRNKLEGPGSRNNPPLYYYNDTMDFLAMFCTSHNKKCISALSSLNNKYVHTSKFYFSPPRLHLFSGIIYNIWRKESMLTAEYSAQRDAKIFHLPLLYKYIFDEFNKS